MAADTSRIRIDVTSYNVPIADWQVSVINAEISTSSSGGSCPLR